MQTVTTVQEREYFTLEQREFRRGTGNEGGRVCWSSHSYHAVLAINRAATGFRGINGGLPAKRGSPPFIPRSHRASIDNCARRDGQQAGNPAQESLEPSHV
jgi:hypothetical protein